MKIIIQILYKLFFLYFIVQIPLSLGVQTSLSQKNIHFIASQNTKLIVTPIGIDGRVIVFNESDIFSLQLNKPLSFDFTGLAAGGYDIYITVDKQGLLPKIEVQKSQPETYKINSLDYISERLWHVFFTGKKIKPFIHSHFGISKFYSSYLLYSKNGKNNFSSFFKEGTIPLNTPGKVNLPPTATYVIIHFNIVAKSNLPPKSFISFYYRNSSNVPRFIDRIYLISRLKVRQNYTFQIKVPLPKDGYNLNNYLHYQFSPALSGTKQVVFQAHINSWKMYYAHGPI